MYTISLFSSDTALQSSPMNNISKPLSSSSLRRIGTIKLLILAIAFPIMLLTILNPMWICVFMKYPHLHRIPTNVEVPHGENPQSHTHTKLYNGGVKVTKETFDIIVESKDGHRIEELETTITVIENIPPNSENQHQDTNETANTKINKTPVTSKADSSESVMDRIRERIFRDRTSCAYVALSVILLCAATVCSILCLTSGDKKMYEPLNDAENNYVIDCGDDDKTNVTEKSNENNVAENKNAECTQV